MDRLLKNREVLAVDQIDTDARSGDNVQAYGYRIITDDPRFGEVTSVMSFPNDSNGYYGGELEHVVRPRENYDDIPVLSGYYLGGER